jgi:16S rRNA (cytosine1402-N4)-methyltransferase
MSEARAFAHTSVMANEAIEQLAPRPGGRYCDATLGGGGHAARLLEASAPDGRLFGLDRDPDALEAAARHLGKLGELGEPGEWGRATLMHARFSEIAAVLERAGALPLDGILADLGVSSPQLDRPERGFSFRAEGPLDMRMDPTRGETAAELIRRLDEGELADVLRNYGEERFSGRIAREMKQAMSDHKLTTTRELADLVAGAVPRREPRIDPATRTFQALRIAVNGELDELDALLEAAPPLLREGGRIVIITFHSLEDRIVKHAFRGDARLEVVTKKPLSASDREQSENPRARSAKLRAAAKTSRGGS